jgi:hypothetical protein
MGPFLGKPDGLKRCLQNLIDNATRYGRDVELQIEDSTDTLTLYVRDSGPGIPEQELERVFEPFYRVEASRNPNTCGSGLRLSIARNLAHSMGGDVMLRNREGAALGRGGSPPPWAGAPQGSPVQAAYPSPFSVERASHLTTVRPAGSSGFCSKTVSLKQRRLVRRRVRPPVQALGALCAQRTV